MPLQATSGAASYDGFGGGVVAEPNYIESVFSTYLYTGNGSTQTITNGIDLSGKGGLVWTKSRTAAFLDHELTDTVRGAGLRLISNSTAEQGGAGSSDTTSFTTTGFGLTYNNGNGNLNNQNYVSWTFRKQPKFFDVVTYSGNSANNRAISHNLGSTPGCIIVKNITNSADWGVWHRSLTSSQELLLNTTDSAYNYGAFESATSTTFTVNDSGYTNQTGSNYVAYLFAHDAGGFGLTGTDNVISCGSWTGTGTSPGPTTTLGYEPQWIIWKRTDAGTESWHIRDNMRGMPVTASGKDLYADSSSAEGSTTNEGPIPTATGFQIIGTNTNANASGGTYIYIAIRRGPMAVPTLGTTVFEPVTSTSANDVLGSLQAFDMGLFKDRNTVANNFITDRLRGFTSYFSPTLYTNLSNAEATPTTGDTVYSITSAASRPNGQAYFGGAGLSTDRPLGYSFKRAPGFFDVVCYTGTGADPQTVSHNLGKAPELMIFKARGVAAGWRVWGGNMAITEYLALSETSAVVTGSTFFGSTTPTATSFYVGSGLSVSGRTHVAYLFATAAGVSKVFSYTGNGSSQTINCGFTGGARFVLIKRTDSTGDWYVWDTARGIVAGNDPHLSLNTTSAEVTTDDTIDTDSTGFVVNQVSATNVNVSSATYIGFAVA